MSTHGYLLGTILLITCNLHAQQLFNLGVRGGVGASDIIARSDSDDDDQLFSPNLSYSINGYFAHKFSKYNKYYWFTVEPGYIQKGAINYDDIKSKLHYLTVSSLFLFYPTRDLGVGVGPEINYLIKANHRYLDQSTDQTRYYNEFEYGMTVEAGYWVSIPWYIGIRYGLAFNRTTEKLFTINGSTVTVNEYNHYLHLVLRLRLFQQQMYGR